MDNNVNNNLPVTMFFYSVYSDKAKVINKTTLYNAYSVLGYRGAWWRTD